MAQDFSSGGDVAGRVRDIRRYPVSSMGGELLQEVAVEATGLSGDRKYGLYAVETGEVAAPGRHKHWRSLPNVLARLGAQGVEVSIDQAKWVDMRDGERALSDYLGFAVVFRAYDGAKALPLYELSPIHLLTTSSMATLQEILPDAAIDARRFRCNLVIETLAGAETIEQGWMGKQLAIGSAIIEPSEPCVRCAFTSIGQEPGIPFDKRIHTAISQRLDGNLGVYCKVVKAGTVRAGDVVRVGESAVAR